MPRSPNDTTPYAGKGRRRKDTRIYMGARVACTEFREELTAALDTVCEERGMELSRYLAEKILDQQDPKLALAWAKLLLPMIAVDPFEGRPAEPEKQAAILDFIKVATKASPEATEALSPNNRIPCG